MDTNPTAGRFYTPAPVAAALGLVYVPSSGTGSLLVRLWEEGLQASRLWSPSR
jgi:hypothetical protein